MLPDSGIPHANAVRRERRAGRQERVHGRGQPWGRERAAVSFECHHARAHLLSHKPKRSDMRGVRGSIPRASHGERVLWGLGLVVLSGLRLL